MRKARTLGSDRFHLTLGSIIIGRLALDKLLSCLSLSFPHLYAKESSPYSLHCFKDPVLFPRAALHLALPQAQQLLSVLLTLICRFVATLDGSAQTG